MIRGKEVETEHQTDTQKINLNLGSTIDNSSLDHKFQKRDNPNLVERLALVGGSTSEVDRYEYAVRLLNKSGYFVCGGSLITSDLVLTAAHCEKFLEGGKAEIKNHNVHVNNIGQEIFDIESMIKHPDFINRNGLHDDVMIVKLRGNSIVKPVALNKSNTVNSGQPLTVIGWGRLGEKHSLSDTLKEAKVDYIPNEVCKYSQGSFIHKSGMVNYLGLIHDDNMCALGVHENGNVKDSCYGDSGGPLIIKGNHPSQDIQVGIVSWGLECANPDLPGVYARISHQFDWIKATVCNLSQGNPNTNNPNFMCTTPKVTSTRSILLQAKLDNHPQEFGWELFQKVDNKDILIYERPNGFYSGRNNDEISEVLDLIDGETYKLSITDTYGDGLNTVGNNVILSYLDDKQIIIKAWKGNWGKQQVEEFTVRNNIGPDIGNTEDAFISLGIQFGTHPDRLSWKLISTKSKSNTEDAFISLGIQFGPHPDRLSWKLIIMESKSVIANSSSYSANSKGQKITEKIFVDPGQKYKLFVFESFQSIKSQVKLSLGNEGMGKTLMKLKGNW
eukprot:CAMPEP_0184871636 /NCGR_PEP_ID=MMETSP0580-20130426/40833_1 /TAXON_ID=1118495 /ORGANISM="Dactyliosolen fragilissimus" /LENGTH=557 /DNA_ID=CAMNT_0027374323 /DNA_START=49 /DNA_END=1719 /DNA_ORIENTATION=+